MVASLMLSVVVSGVVGLGEPLPEVLVIADDTEIRESCRIVIPEGLVIEDDEGDGVIKVVDDLVTIEFVEGSVLRGAAPDTPGDELAGIGIVVDGATDVTIRGAQVHGFKVGVSAIEADGLVVEDADLSSNYRQRLRSNAQREDVGDWLYPHRNDDNEWVTQHGAALAIEESREVTVRRVRVREGQNGIVLDEVTDSKIYDNDCSFLSGWGLAMWRSSRNTVSRNAFDFCIRGHEEGVYNRGQDSAGILMFEQCNDNLVIENSCTHGGDGIFGFGGREAIGEVPARDGAEIDYADAGCNGNVFIGNDLSYASAHGFEMTFSERNVVAYNRFVENGICGIWGGYSSVCPYVYNEFRGNGALGYGAERGGINIEHGSQNFIVGNSFDNNRVGVRLWWDDDSALLAKPGVKSGYRGVVLNTISQNTFVMNADHPFGREADGELVGVQIQNIGAGGVVERNAEYRNEFRIEEGVGSAFQTDPGTIRHIDSLTSIDLRPPEPEAIGDTRPVGARAALRGRDKIVMGEWGPWDHEGVFVRQTSARGGEAAYEIRGIEGKDPLKPRSVGGQVEVLSLDPIRGVREVRVRAKRAGITPYEVKFAQLGDITLSGTLVKIEWEAAVWAWKADPLGGDVEAWCRESEGVSRVSLDSLEAPFGYGGPGGHFEAFSDAAIGGDRFGLIARAAVPLKAGTWRVRTLSDDGIRVMINGETLIERWDIHGPTEDSATFTLDEDGDVSCVVEYFENDGYATLGVWFEPVE